MQLSLIEACLAKLNDLEEENMDDKRLTFDEMDAYSSGTVVLDCSDDAWQKEGDFWFAYAEVPMPSFDLSEIYGPCRLIWEP